MGLIDKIKKYGPYLAGLGVFVIGSYFVGSGGCSFYRYLADKNSEDEQKEAPKQKNTLEQIAQEDSVETIIDAKGDQICHFKPEGKIKQDVFYKFSDLNTGHDFFNYLVLPLRKAHKCQIGDRMFTKYEMLQIFNKTNVTEDYPNLRIINEDEVASKIEEIKGKTPEEIRKIFDLDLDPPSFAFNPTDPDKAYQDAVSAARAEYQAAGKLSDLTRMSADAAYKTDLYKRQCEQARCRAVWDAKRLRR
ncbi:Uncharacterised protein [uncultured archaeon]|nr:Uncharacterised protein [uncultured archaeon]